MAYTLEIKRDDKYSIADLLPEPLMHIAYSKRSSYALGTKALDRDEMDAIRADPDSYFSLPVYAYVHGGATIRLGPFSDPWDSGCSGFIYGEKAQLAKEFGHKRWCSATRKRCEAAAKNVVEEVDSILRGDVYGYQVLDDVTGDVVDSCWGYIGKQYCREAGEEALKYYAKEHDGQAQTDQA